ncbi:MAG TPA: tetratricopeptide repeat protein, partial [Bryocella sp.]|nr:tetratricopeptide repeat protein [Bryocella sp.]
INPSDPLIDVHMGFVEQFAGDPRQAIAYYQKALDLTEGDVTNSAQLRADALHNMGLAYRALGDLHRAEECFSAAAQLDWQYKK